MKLRDIILVIERLYRTYNEERVKSADDIAQNTARREELTTELNEQRAELMHYKEMAEALRSREPNSINGKIAELTSQIALLDVNNIRLSRKYECL